MSDNHLVRVAVDVPEGEAGPAKAFWRSNGWQFEEVSGLLNVTIPVYSSRPSATGSARRLALPWPLQGEVIEAELLLARDRPGAWYVVKPDEPRWSAWRFRDHIVKFPNADDGRQHRSLPHGQSMSRKRLRLAWDQSTGERLPAFWPVLGAVLFVAFHGGWMIGEASVHGANLWSMMTVAFVYLLPLATLWSVVPVRSGSKQRAENLLYFFASLFVGVVGFSVQLAGLFVAALVALAATIMLLSAGGIKHYAVLGPRIPGWLWAMQAPVTAGLLWFANWQGSHTLEESLGFPAAVLPTNSGLSASTMGFSLLALVVASLLVAALLGWGLYFSPDFLGDFMARVGALVLVLTYGVAAAVIPYAQMGITAESVREDLVRRHTSARFGSNQLYRVCVDARDASGAMYSGPWITVYTTDGRTWLSDPRRADESPRLPAVATEYVPQLDDYLPDGVTSCSR